MLKQFLPKRDIFFTLFQKLVEKNHLGSENLVKLLEDLKNAKHHVQQISIIEKEGDNITRHIFDELHKTFVTPFDREDIHRLATQLDDVLDQINRAARRILLYEMTDLPDEILTLGNLVIQNTQLLNKAVSALEHPSKAKMVIHLCDSVHELEEQADRIISTSMSSLFSLESDFKSFLKMKEIYEGFQTVFKSCKNAAIVVKSIMLEYV
ncbi:MAG: hypothetical protein A3I12_04080 [Gammaproteobacteria bacterium RIFCSPLOWO2_02_FULL_38_11]|nr:MAG: hypothetical protein A3B69_01055 [Gammaproteobacteria bacterium RIFCSPHIGHO2_02_FULL_38_33]OGT67441.1 MAG: hypothetical protein A3I12_04080 [Gammaproteobacteria bacterium RIFCSPLOWO2_02_FULL_38_11]OGT78016.1 MAG: hypothetical protein A3G71_03300 [Gammaproteobacteria bacterium RIFCSPLOWO2_12_FULL_38_14]